MKKTIYNLLKEFGLSKKQSEIFIYLYGHGSKPASTIASSVGGERTNIYRILKRMVNRSLISEITKSGVKHFFIADKKILSHEIEQQYNLAKKKKKLIDDLEDELKEIEKENFSSRPKIVFFEGSDGVKQMFKNMYNEIDDNKYINIKMFASNTLDNKSPFYFSEYSEDFLKKLKKEKISIDAYLGNGIMLLENIEKTNNTDMLLNLPAGNSAISTFIFGDFVYILIFKDSPFGIKIENPEYASMMSFLLKKVNVTTK